MIVKIDRGAFLVGSSHDSQAVHYVLDGLTFLHHLHKILLDHSLLKITIRISCSGTALTRPGLLVHRLEACNVLCLKAFGAFRHFKLHRLTFIQGLITVHLDRGEVHENIFSGLALDEPVTF
jgi:hypothetical protein